MTEKSILITVPTYKDKQYCQDEFLDAVAALEIPADHTAELVIVVNTDNMVTDTSYMLEMEELLKKKELNAVIARVDMPYPYGNQTRLCWFYNVIRGLCNVGNYDYMFNIESDVIVQPWHLKKLIDEIEKPGREDVGMICGVTEYEDEGYEDVVDKNVMIFKEVPLDEMSVDHINYSVPIITNGQVGWIRVKAPVITAKGQMPNVRGYTKPEMLKLSEKGAVFEVQGGVLGCSLIRGEALKRIYFRYNTRWVFHNDYCFNIDLRREGWRVFCDSTVWPRHRSKTWSSEGGHVFSKEDEAKMGDRKLIDDMRK